MSLPVLLQLLLLIPLPVPLILVASRAALSVAPTNPPPATGCRKILLACTLWCELDDKTFDRCPANKPGGDGDGATTKKALPTLTLATSNDNINNNIEGGVRQVEVEIIIQTLFSTLISRALGTSLRKLSKRHTLFQKIGVAHALYLSLFSLDTALLLLYSVGAFLSSVIHRGREYKDSLKFIFNSQHALHLRSRRCCLRPIPVVEWQIMVWNTSTNLTPSESTRSRG